MTFQLGKTYLISNKLKAKAILIKDNTYFFQIEGYVALYPFNRKGNPLCPMTNFKISTELPKKKKFVNIYYNSKQDTQETGMFYNDLKEAKNNVGSKFEFKTYLKTIEVELPDE